MRREVLVAERRQDEHAAERLPTHGGRHPTEQRPRRRPEPPAGGPHARAVVRGAGCCGHVGHPRSRPAGYGPANCRAFSRGAIPPGRRADDALYTSLPKQVRPGAPAKPRCCEARTRSPCCTAARSGCTAWRSWCFGFVVRRDHQRADPAAARAREPGLRRVRRRRRVAARGRVALAPPASASSNVITSMPPALYAGDARIFGTHFFKNASADVEPARATVLARRVVAVVAHVRRDVGEVRRRRRRREIRGEHVEPDDLGRCTPASR